MLFGNRSSAVDWLIAGLGNPGEKYAHTRHNMGFLTADLLAEQAGVKLNKVKFKSAYNILSFAGARCLVMKPQTYMNLSGEAVREAAQFYKIPADHVLVIYDDISLPVGKIRVRPTGSAGGHNGIKNIIAHLGTQEFQRIRVGVGEKPKEYDLAAYVLGRFTAEDRRKVEEAFADAADAVSLMVRDETNEAMNRYNRKKAQEPKTEPKTEAKPQPKGAGQEPKPEPKRAPEKEE